MLELGKKFYMTEVAPKNKPGFRLTDQALVNAAWHLENSFAHGVSGGRMGMYAWEWDGIFDYPPVPPGLKIDTDDPVGVTRNLKKAASFFGAALVGVCKLDRRWAYSSIYPHREQKSLPNTLSDEYQYAVALAIGMDYAAIRYSPTSPASAATGLGYSKMAFTAGLLCMESQRESPIIDRTGKVCSGGRSMPRPALPSGPQTARIAPTASEHVRLINPPAGFTIRSGGVLRISLF